MIMRLLYLPLGLLILTALFTSYFRLASADDDVGIMNLTDSVTGSISGNQTLTGSEDSLNLEDYDVDLAINFQDGLIAVVVGLIAIGVTAGITILGSGLAEYSVMILFKTIGYYSIWILFSTIGIDGFVIIPFFGWMVYFFLTVVYSLGIMESIS